MAETTFLTILGITVNIDTCPITANDFYPSCANYLERSFDYIIVGGGTAGCTLANRLSADPNINVLLLEAGDFPSRESEIPLNFPYLQQTYEDWQFKAWKEDFFQAYANYSNWPQGHLLGGGSGINAMIYAPGFEHDYNVWAQHADERWSWDSMQPYFASMAQNVKTTSYIDTNLGRVHLQAAATFRGFPVNGNGWYGYHDVPITVFENTRFSMAEAYIKPIADRQNLCVVVNRHVNKIIMDPVTKVALSVEIQTPSGDVVYVSPLKEIIVTAGAINSAKLLMLSGIGPADHLNDLNIPIIADLPVGKNLQDHAILPVITTILDKPMTNYQLLVASYCLDGLLLNNIGLGNFLGFFNTREETTHPNIEFMHFQFFMNDQFLLNQILKVFGMTDFYADQIKALNRLYNILFFLPIILHPKSKGRVFLRDLDPSTKPFIEAHYLDHPDDVQDLIDSINQVIEPMLNTPTFLGTQIVKLNLPQCNNFVFKSFDYWKCYAQVFITTVYHQAGTCRMGRSPLDSVVGPDLKVWGITNLRVADSSIIPELISGHTNIASCLVGERGANIILTE